MQRHTFKEAVAVLEVAWIDYGVEIDGHRGALMTREDFKNGCDECSFIDYDGSGNQVMADGTLTEKIRPSTIGLLREDTAYILWYNR